MPNGTKKRSNSNSYPSTDLTNARHSPITDSNPNVWNGSQADQAQWLNAKLREAKSDYIFNALVATGAIPITTRGYTQQCLDHSTRWSTYQDRTSAPSKNPTCADESLNVYRTSTPSAPTPPGTHGG